MIQKIRRWWRWEGKHLHRDIKQGFKNLWKWLPVIWKDRDWDSHFIFEILKHKLKSQANYLEIKNRYVGVERDVRNMKICVSLIQKVQNEYYNTEYLDYSEKRVWFQSYENSPDLFELKEENISENYDEFFKKYPRIYKKVLRGEGVFNIKGREDDKSLIAMNISQINHNRARRLLFKIMEENIEGWWD